LTRPAGLPDSRLPPNSQAIRRLQREAVQPCQEICSRGIAPGTTDATAANGGNPVNIYSPNPWEDGSSGSHLDDDFFSGANAQLMNASDDDGLGVRQVSPIEIAILRDMGYLDIVPEPSGMVLLALSLGAWFLPRRRP